MPYIPWWQRLSPPTFAERFELGGLAGRLPFNYGGKVKRQNFFVPGLVLGYEAIAALTAATGLGIEAVRRYSQANIDCKKT